MTEKQKLAVALEIDKPFDAEYYMTHGQHRCAVWLKAARAHLETLNGRSDVIAVPKTMHWESFDDLKLVKAVYGTPKDIGLEYHVYTSQFPDALSPCVNEGEECQECHGTGEVFTHRMDCYDDLCALNGDEHSCTGVIVPCSCSSTSAAVKALEAHHKWMIANSQHIPDSGLTEYEMSELHDETVAAIEAINGKTTPKEGA